MYLRKYSYMLIRRPRLGGHHAARGICSNLPICRFLNLVDLQIYYPVRSVNLSYGDPEINQLVIDGFRAPGRTLNHPPPSFLCPGGGPGRVSKSIKIPKGCTWPADLCKFAAHYHQKSPTWRHRVPKCTATLTFGSSEGHFSSEIRDSGPLPEPWYLLRFRNI